MSRLEYPATTNQLRAEGFDYSNDGKCRGCEALLEWWITPGGARIPMSIILPADPLKSNEEFRQPHFIDCPNAGDFRRK